MDSSFVFGGQFLDVQGVCDGDAAAYPVPGSVADTRGRWCFECGRAKGGGRKGGVMKDIELEELLIFFQA